MDVFELREQLIGEYQSYATSFMRFRDERIRAHVQHQLDNGRLWKHPQIGLNPSFERGGTVAELVERGLLHEQCADIFRAGKSESDTRGVEMTLHKHQVEGIERARAGKNYVLTTGTGSGKSLSYIVPIVDHVLRNGTGRGPQAIIVYPMNALANSQEEELRKFIDHGSWGKRKPVTFACYTGQESPDQKTEFLERPPDIILTNYVMLELILTRQREKKLVKAFSDLRFLVLDELHTYRGRQGADVALLVRRLREASGSQSMLTIGTSATMSSEGEFEDRQRKVGEVASKIFGAAVEPEDVVGESLRRATPDPGGIDLADADPSFVTALTARVSSQAPAPTDYESFVADPLSSWIETWFGLRRESDDRLVRAIPTAIPGEGGGAEKLEQLSGVDRDVCERMIQEQLLAGYAVQSESGFPAFAFRLHQFLSRGDTVYATLGEPGPRYITVNEQQFAPGKADRIPMFPMAFCRECGEEYYLVNKNVGRSSSYLTPRRLYESVSDGNSLAGFIHIGEWSGDLPAEWLDDHGDVLRTRRGDVPQRARVSERGGIDGDDCDIDAYWFETPFRFCLHCGVSYDTRKDSGDYARLAQLGTEGRSTATTILGLAAVRFLRNQADLADKAKKLLSFTDNRQDASLQAGHFNDFIQVTMLRSALWRAAVVAGHEGLTHDEVARRVLDEMALPAEAFMPDPSVKGQARSNAERVLRDVLEYRIFADLERGWRVTQPNLEQCGLIKVDYPSLDDLAADEEEWSSAHQALTSIDISKRRDILHVLLDWIRRHLAVKTRVLEEDDQHSLKRRSESSLTGPWAIEDGDKLVFATKVLPRSRRSDGSDERTMQYLSARGAFGKHLRRSTIIGRELLPDLTDVDQVIGELLDRLRVYGLVEIVDEDKDGTPHYQIPASALRWVAGDGSTAYHDPLRTPTAPPERRTNEFFVDLYKSVGEDLSTLEAREHTAQVESDERIRREELFREAQLPVLFCSPTMELGVDISQLNVVNMRNVPPTPANYAQRSGRAGRSGQPALVFTYAAAQSPHDQWYFQRPELMVAGEVQAPRLELANEDLLRAHVQAVWLSQSALNLGNGLGDEVLDLTAQVDDPPLFAKVIEELRHVPTKEAARIRVERVLADLGENLEEAPWWHERWIDDCLDKVEDEFVKALGRWKGLYVSALQQLDEQNRRIGDATTKSKDRRVAQRLHREADNQLQLLRSDSQSRSQADFNAYRYFASEGFLPGYSFPRLPLSAYVPGQRGKPGDFKMLQRPRFLAVREFGPHSLIYHEGARYRVNRVIMPVGESTGDDGKLLTHRAKRCEQCGYLHEVDTADPIDLCLRCKSELPVGWGNLFRLLNVSTVRRDRISSDEEERQRVGYEIVTGVRFAERDDRLSYRSAVLSAEGQQLFQLSYGDTTNIWRVNLGWRKRKDNNTGFVLDVERGYWSQDGHAMPTGDQDEPMSNRTQRVIPFVEDWRNALLIEPRIALDTDEMATLQAALKRSFEVTFQLEDNEIAAEPLPTLNDRSLLLFYESAEGGAGVLRRLIDEPDTWQTIADNALEIAHIDPRTGAELPTKMGEACEAGCYECLLSYSNQMEHRLIDRHRIKSTLQRMQQAELRTEATPPKTARPAPQDSVAAAKPVESTVAGRDQRSVDPLANALLNHLSQGGYRLPDNSEPHLVESVGVTVDFVYRDAFAVVFVDGAPADPVAYREAAGETDRKLKDAGLSVIRFGHRDDWAQTIDTFAKIFGEGTQA